MDTFKPEDMKPSDAAIALIKQFEACSLDAYQDAKGLWTIGWGHKLGRYLSPYAPQIAQSLADAILATDLADAGHIVGSFVIARLSQPQYDALCSLIFNIGSGEFLDSTLRIRLNMNEYRSAACQLLRWDHLEGSVCHGLRRRRIAEYNLFLSGTK